MYSTTGFFTESSAYSLAFLSAIGATAYISAGMFLPKFAQNVAKERFTWIWLVFDALTHFSFNVIFLYHSTFGRTVISSRGTLVEMVKEYSLADLRWGVADPTVVSFKIITVFGAGPMACYVLYLLAKDDPARHYWIVVLSTAELYGVWMTFCPEWLTGSPNLVTSNRLYLWVYLTLMNSIWVIVPLWLMYDSYTHIARAVRGEQAIQRRFKTS